MQNNPGGKGSAARPLLVERSTFEENFDRIFRKAVGSPQNKPVDPTIEELVEINAILFKKKDVSNA